MTATVKIPDNWEPIKSNESDFVLVKLGVLTYEYICIQKDFLSKMNDQAARITQVLLIIMIFIYISFFLYLFYNRLIEFKTRDSIKTT